MISSIKETVKKLESAIATYSGDTGPVRWTATFQGNKALLVGTYDYSPDKKESYLTDEVWTQYGGDAILDAAGLEMFDSGIDTYKDTWGDDVVSQWVSIECTEDE